MARRLLCLHPGAIGDIVLAIPALANLKVHGDVHLTAACIGDRGSLVDMSGVADIFFDIDTFGLWRILAGPCDLTDRVRDFVSSFDSAIFWTSDKERNIRATLTDCGMDPVVVAPAIPPTDWQSHASRYYASTLAPFGVPPVCGVPRLDPDDSAMEWARTFLGGSGDRTAVLHPGSGARQKRWSIDGFARVAEWLRDTAGMEIVWMTGQAEDAADINSVIGPKDRCADDVTLPRMAAILKSSAIYIGNDSGPTHCAAAVETPAIALFGPTDPSIWSPLGGHTTIVQGRSPCAPCTADQRRACTDAKCMESISVDDVLKIVRTVVGG